MIIEGYIIDASSKTKQDVKGWNIGNYKIIEPALIMSGLYAGKYFIAKDQETFHSFKMVLKGNEGSINTSDLS